MLYKSSPALSLAGDDFININTMIVITDFELQQSLQNCINNSPAYYPFIRDFMQLLYNSGCRPHEALDLSLWSFDGASLYYLNPLKNNNTRSFIEADLPLSFRNAINAKFLPYSLINYRSFSYQFSRLYQYPTASILNKSCGLYLFRHAFIKRLYDAGYTIEQIRQTTGHKSDAVVEGYINSMIYY